MWDSERILAALLAFAGAACVWEASDLPLWHDFSLGSGAAPIVYGSAVVLLATAVGLSSSRLSVVSLQALIRPPGRSGALLLMLVVALAAAAPWIGFIAGLFLFSLLTLTLALGWRVGPAVAFSLAWSAALYITFVLLLDVPFPEGRFFGS